METFFDKQLNGGIGDPAASSFHQIGILDLGRDVFCPDQFLHGNLYIDYACPLVSLYRLTLPLITGMFKVEQARARPRMHCSSW